MSAIDPTISMPPMGDSILVRGKPRSKTVRNFREAVILAGRICCGLFTVVVTLSILGILLWNTWGFFTVKMTDIQGAETSVSVADFLFDLKWSPIAEGDRHFGIWPLITGTMQVTVVAMALALPLGLITAIWLSEYANSKVRNIIKPVLEIIAGVPTVVFGYFALTVITPNLRFNFFQVAATNYETGEVIRDAAGNAIMVPWNPMHLDIFNALSAGIAVGIMCIPIVTSLSEDALRAVPRALREGAYGMGSSRFETSTRVVVPAALSGIIAAFLLAIARAVGETMIVALAAGAQPPHLYDGVQHAAYIGGETQTMTAYMVQIFTGDIQHGGVEYYSCYTVAGTLFLITLILTLIGGVIRRRFRQVYD